MGAADMKAREFQSWSSVAPGWRKHDKRLTGKLPEDRKLAYADEVAVEAEHQSVRKPGVALPAVTWIAWGRK
jgi:hypothetical protein